MRSIELLLFLPAVMAVIWALTVKIKQNKIFDTIVLSICGLTILLNGLIMYFVMADVNYPVLLKYAQQLVSAAVVPLAYLYFSNQIAAKWNHVVMTLTWSLFILFLLPHAVIFLDRQPVLHEELRAWTFHFVRGGKTVLKLYTADIVVALQAFVTLLRIPHTAQELRHYNMKIPRYVRFFFYWWLLAIVFIIFTSFTTTETMSQEPYRWFYFGSLTFLITSIFVLLALDLDLRPRLKPLNNENEEEEEHTENNQAELRKITDQEKEIIVEDIRGYIEASSRMADIVRHMMTVDQVYLRSGYTSKDMIAALGTNRTYFSRMMMTEFGVHFSDWLTHERIAHAKKLMQTTNDTLSIIAAESGFTDAAALSEKFKIQEGIAPSLWRKTARSVC